MAKIWHNMNMDIYDAITRIFIAVILGAIIGIERELTQKSAGLRTHILVALGATVFMIVSVSNLEYGSHIFPGGHFDQDPSRIGAQIVSGIGFIGGGAVLRYGTTVRGLTTAASLWTMASIGMLVGVGQYRLAFVSTIVAFLVLFTIGRVERHFFTKNSAAFNRMRVNVTSRLSGAAPTQSWMETHYRASIIEAKTRTDAQTDKVEMHYVLMTLPGKGDVNQISRQICSLAGVISTTVKTYYENEDIS